MIESYNRTIQELQSKTKTTDIKDILKNYKSVEEDNFSLFIYVNEINNEVEKLSSEHLGMQKKIQHVTHQHSSNEGSKTKTLTTLETQFNACTQKSQEYTHKHAELDMTLRSLIQSVGKIMDVMKNISSPFVEESECKVLGEESNQNGLKSLIGNPNQEVSVTEENIVKILGMVESETNDIVTLNHIFSFSKKSNTVASTITGIFYY